MKVSQSALVLFSVWLLSSVPNVSANFAERKAHLLKELDERATKLQEHKSCVSAAADQEALKACRGKMKEWRRAEKEERLEFRKDRLDKRQSEIEAKKAD